MPQLRRKSGYVIHPVCRAGFRLFAAANHGSARTYCGNELIIGSAVSIWLLLAGLGSRIRKTHLAFANSFAVLALMAHYMIGLIPTALGLQSGEFASLTRINARKATWAR